MLSRRLMDGCTPTLILLSKTRSLSSREARSGFAEVRGALMGARDLRLPLGVTWVHGAVPQLRRGELG